MSLIIVAECNCNITGTVDPSLPCELVHGQCGCKAGVTGRQCDQCEHMYVGFGPNGCISKLIRIYSQTNDSYIFIYSYSVFNTRLFII